MTLCIAWVRQANEKEEILMAADSCFSGGQRFLAAPKLFPTRRGDCAFACAGMTQYSFPIVEHILRAFDINQKLRDRASDITDVMHIIADIANKCLHEEIAPEYASLPGDGPGFSMIIAGYSWKKKKTVLRILSFDWSKMKMEICKVPTILGFQCAVIGDKEVIGPCRGRIHHKLYADIQEGSTLNMQPLDILLDYISDTAYTTIGGYPQLLKIYPFMNILPFGFLHRAEDNAHDTTNLLRGKDENGNQCFITYFGRPLLKYETFPYPIIDLRTKEVRYMYERKGETEFKLSHEEPQALTGFKKST